MKIKIIISWILRLAAAVILLQTLYFKFTAAPESVAIFSKLGIEPWGRIGTGIAELIAAVLLLIPRTVVYGALLGIGIMLGAIVSHIAVIGIQSDNDGGQLFILAWVVFACCAILLLMHKKEIAAIIKKQSVNIL